MFCQSFVPEMIRSSHKSLNMAIIIFHSISVLSMISLIECQRIHFCEAVKANGGSVSYGLTVPDGTTHRKFVIIKDHYWELEFQSGDQSKGNGLLSLKDNCGIQTNFFVKDGMFYDFGFGTRYGGNDLSEPWNYTVLNLFKVNPRDHRIEIIERNFDSLPEEDTVNTMGLNIATMELDLKDFNPEMVFVSFSTQADNTVVYVQQTLSGQPKPKYIVKKRIGRVAAENTPMDSNRKPNLPPAVESALTFFKVKGIYGFTVDSEKNGTIFLIEWCGVIPNDNQPANVGPVPDSANECKGNKYYVYCATHETDPDPMMQNCAPAIVSTKRLIDCSDQSKWKCSTQEDGPQTPLTGTNEAGPDGNKGKDELPGDNGKNGKNTNSSLWFIIAIVVIVVILLMITLTLMFFRRSNAPTGSAKQPPIGSRKATNDGRNLSRQSVATTIKSESLSVPSTRSQIQPNTK